MQFIRKLFINSRNGQVSLTLPKKKLLRILKCNIPPEKLRIEIKPTKDYLRQNKKGVMA